MDIQFTQFDEAKVDLSKDILVAGNCPYSKRITVTSIPGGAYSSFSQISGYLSALKATHFAYLPNQLITK